MAIFIDRPVWPARGRLWSHLVSDVSYAELHAFAEMLGAPRPKALAGADSGKLHRPWFDRDHYDLPADRFRVAVWLGAQVVSSREIVARLYASGLRRKRM